MSLIVMILSITTTAIDNVLTLIIFHQFIYREKDVKKLKIAYIALGVVFCFLLDTFGVNHLFKSLGIVIFGIIYCFYISKKNIGISIFLPIFSMTLVYLSEFTVMGLGKIVFDGEILFKLEQTMPYQIFCMAVSRGILFVFIGLVLLVLQFGKKQFNMEHLNKPYWILVSAGITTLGSTVALLGFSLTIKPELIERIILLISICFLTTTILFVVLIILLASEKTKEYKLQSELLQTERLLHQQDEVSTMYNKLQRLRHDYKNHLLMISSMADQKQIKKYVEELTGEYLYDGKNVKTGNSQIDSLLNSKILLANKHHITVDAEIIFPNELKIPLTDICIVLFNLFDNAIEACNKNKEKENKKIKLRIKQQKGFINITFANPCENPPLKTRDGFKTKKIGELHGIGLRQLNKVAKKNQGDFEAIYNDGLFHARLLIPNVIENCQMNISRFVAVPEKTIRREKCLENL